MGRALAGYAPTDLTTSNNDLKAISANGTLTKGFWRGGTAGMDRITAYTETTRPQLDLSEITPAAARVTLVYFDAGGGHRSTMQALCSATAEARKPWDTESLNLQELLDPVDLAKNLFGIRSQDLYNLILKYGWTLGAAQLLPVLHSLIRLRHSRIVQILESYWKDSKPDLVVSLIPHFNRELAESVRSARPGCPFVTILTDLADFPPHVWIERESQYLICGTDRAAKQAFAMGHTADRVFRTSGMIVNPAFYLNHIRERGADQAALGLEPGRTTGLVLFGGQGSRAMLEIARKLASTDHLQLIFIAGRNPALARELRDVRFRIPVHIEGYTARVPHFMQLSDFFVGKPGPGSLSEAFVAGLPVIVERNAWTLPQERFNTDWIQENDLGLVVRSFRQIRDAVEQMLVPTTLERFRQNALGLGNRAVFEVPEILESILQNANRRLTPTRV